MGGLVLSYKNMADIFVSVNVTHFKRHNSHCLNLGFFCFFSNRSGIKCRHNNRLLKAFISLKASKCL